MTSELLAKLSDKERETLRLIVREHDAKSVARELGLSVHTINERLRDARRKLAVSSSREAARLLFEHEQRHESFGDATIGAASAHPREEEGGGRKRPVRNLLLGVITMIVLALLTLTALAPSSSPPPVAVARTTQAGEAEQAARAWLALLDAGRWGESFDATTESFKRLNTNKLWTETNEKVRPPLGAVRSRTLIAHDVVPGPPVGYDVVKFRTDFANKAGAIETVSLAREDGQWRVVGVYIE